MTTKKKSYHHLTVNVIMAGKKYLALVDSGAQDNYISPTVVNKDKIPWINKRNPYQLNTVEGEPLSYQQGLVDKETAQLQVSTPGWEGSLSFDITNTGYMVILGIPWLRRANPRIDWATGQLYWGEQPAQGSIRWNEDDNSTGLAAGTSRKEIASKPERTSKKMILYLRESTIQRGHGKDPKSYIPEEYLRQHPKLFKPELETGLPQHTEWDHEINLKPGAKLRYHKIYRHTEEELKILREYLEKEMGRNYIRPSISPAGYPTMFVPKKATKFGETTQRLVVDYRELNNETTKNRYPLPLVSELQDRVRKAKWFSAIDLVGAYNLIRIKEGDEWKTAFRTRYGHFEYLVMPFGLTNAPATFQTMINHVLKEYLDQFVITYLDDILVYSETLEEHRIHVHKVLEKLEKANLLVSPEKSEFHKQEVDFLGFTITPGQIRMQKAKVQAVRDWPTPDNVKQVRGFLGFTNFYRRFIKNYGDLARPLTDLTKKGIPFKWNDKAKEAFQSLKKRILEEPILTEGDPDLPYEVETDASDFAIGEQLG